MDDLRIIILDDSSTARVILQSMVEKLGHRVITTFSNGEELLSSLRKEEFATDLILVDINLDPGLNGIQTMTELKKISDVPFIFISGHNEDELLQIAIKSHPIAFLSKPVDLANLKVQLELVKLNRFLADQNNQAVNSMVSDLEEEIEALGKQNHFLEMNVKELTTTNEHLISATWREREMKEEISKNKKLIEVQNEKIRESINYSRSIQQAMITSEHVLKQDLADAKMFYEPRDVVSGDFPWSAKVDDYLYFAAVDCTGHGIPGAMLAIMANIFLDDLVDYYKPDPSKLLEMLHEKVVKSLKQEKEGSTSNDGLDIAACRYNLQTKELEFAGAHRPLYLLKKDGDLVEVRGTKRPIGGTQYKRLAKEFELHSLKVEAGDKVFVFSDGYPDQFGGPDGLKMGSRRIRELIVNNGTKDLSTYKKVLSNYWQDWKGDLKQLDDVLMITVEF